MSAGDPVREPLTDRDERNLEMIEKGKRVAALFGKWRVVGVDPGCLFTRIEGQGSIDLPSDVLDTLAEVEARLAALHQERDEKDYGIEVQRRAIEKLQGDLQKAAAQVADLTRIKDTLHDTCATYEARIAELQRQLAEARR